MPKGIYKRSKKIQNEVKKLIKSVAKQRTFKLEVFSFQDGLIKDTYHVRTIFDAFNIVFMKYVVAGVVVEEVRIV